MRTNKGINNARIARVGRKWGSMKTARIIQLRPPKLKPPPDPNDVYCAACAVFLRACFGGLPKWLIKRAAQGMASARELFFFLGK